MPSGMPMRRREVTKITNAKGGVKRKSKVTKSERWPSVTRDAIPTTGSHGGEATAEPNPTRCHACA